MARGTVATYLHGVLLLALWKPSLQGGGFPSLRVLSGAAPVDQVSHRVYAAVLAGQACMHSGPLFFLLLV